MLPTIPELHSFRKQLGTIDPKSYLDPEKIELDGDNVIYTGNNLVRPINLFPSKDEVDEQYYMDLGYEMILPMKAKDYVPERHSSWWDDPNVAIQAKHDGIRSTMHIRNGINRIFSGRVVKNGWTGDNTDRLPHLRDINLYPYRGTVLDGEIISPNGHSLLDFKYTSGTLNSKPLKAIENQIEKGFLVFTVFDCPIYKGYDIRHMPYRFRYAMAMNVILQKNDMGVYVSKNPFIQPTSTIWDKSTFMINHMMPDKRAFLDYISQIGAEGVILKKNKSPYKYKHKSSDMLKLKDKITLDMVCIGFGEANEGKTGQFKGLIGQMHLGVYMKPDEAKRRKLKEIDTYTHFVNNKVFKLDKKKGYVLVNLGKISGMTVAERKDMTEHPEKYINEVVELECNRTYQDTRIPRNPRYIRLHEQKNGTDVTFENHCEQADVLQIYNT